MGAAGTHGLSILLLARLTLAGAAGAEGASTASGILASQPRDVVERLFEKKVAVSPGREASGRESDEFVIALVLFAKPRTEVIRLFVQTERQIEYRTDLERIETVERFENGNVDEHHMRIMFVDVRYRLRNRWDTRVGRFWWDLDPSFDNDVRAIEGFWELYELDASRTLGRIGSRVDVGPVLPGFLQNSVARKNLLRTLERCRRWVDSAGSYRP